MRLYNTRSGKIEEFVPLNKECVTMYTCGPTVYHYAHIGNLRSYIMEDILEKSLNFLGYSVKRVMNITDVGHLKSDSDSGEDRMVASAKREHKTVMDIAKFYTDEFFKDFDLLNCRRPDIVSPATDNIDIYIKMISKLLDDDIAYKSGGNVYFDVSKANDYYCLTNHKVDEMVVGVREGVEYDEFKRNQADFALWFTKSKFEDQELKWDSPFGTGYPGWHIECSGINLKYFGDTLDIHGGAIDNIFPHHTNEIAQTEAYTKKPWCHYWFHNEFLNDDTGKMSKSKGAILTVSLLKEQGFNPLSFRYMCLLSHFRKQLVFAFDNLAEAENAYKKLLSRIESLTDSGEYEEDKFKLYTDKFKEVLSDNLNTANAITLLYDLLKDNEVNDKTKKEIIKSFDEVLSLDLIKEKKQREDHDEIMKKIEERNNAKKERNFELADKIRNELLEKGIMLVDTREGTTYKEV